MLELDCSDDMPNVVHCLILCEQPYTIAAKKDGETRDYQGREFVFLAVTENSTHRGYYHRCGIGAGFAGPEQDILLERLVKRKQVTIL